MTLGRSAPTRSRVALDAADYLVRRERAREIEPATLDTVPPLADVCLRVLAASYGEPGVLDALDPIRHRDYVPRLLDSIEAAARRDGDAEAAEPGNATLPFQTWLDVTSRCAADTPTSRKTYRGLVVSDSAELRVLKELNQDSEPRYLQALSSASLAESKPPPPAFFLAYLDLSSVTSFGDGDIYKLRDPLSHFLATLRLDGTAVTGGGLEWIARAARDKPQYQQLAILRLRGLRQVTDAAVVPVAANLANLRVLGEYASMLRRAAVREVDTPSTDVRGSGCTAAVGTQINRAMAQDRLGTTKPRLNFFRRPNEVRKGVEKLPSTGATISVHIELEVFDPSNFSPAHAIAILHYLGAEERSESKPLSTFKPLGVDLNALTRAPATGTSAANTPKTAEQVYEAQIALQAKLSHAAHHATYGGLTSTVALSRDAIAESGSKEPGERGAAFRVRNDAVMGGKSGGDVAPAGSLYAAGLKRVHPDGKGKWTPHDRDAYSDDETEANEEAAYVAAETAAIEAKQREDEESALFYRYRLIGQDQREIKRRGERTFAIPPREDGMLIRFMPYVSPWEHKELESAAAPAGTQELARELKKRRQGDARTGGPSTPALVKKRRRDENAPELLPMASDTQPQRTAHSSSPASLPFFGPSSSASPRGKPASQADRSLFTPRSDPKNLVKTGKALPKRSSLAAFRR